MSDPQTAEIVAPQYRYSIVIPTHQRLTTVQTTVNALGQLDYPSFEIIVVVDGGGDGTKELLSTLRLPVPLRVLDQPHSGASRARNHGAQHADGTIILFLDDDMIAAPDLLREHDRAYDDGADAVLGHIPVAPSSPPSFLTRNLAVWAEERRERLVRAEGRMEVQDVLTGQLSVHRTVFESLGGFDERFTRGGAFGGEDTDFGKRFLESGHSVVFVPTAVSEQNYVVTPQAYLTQWHQAGLADVAYVRKHPREGRRILESRRPERHSNRYLARPLARCPPVSRPVAAMARRVVVELARLRPHAPAVEQLFFLVRNLEYWRGVNEAGGLPRRRPFRVLCYHSVRDLHGAPVIEQYGVPAPWLRVQLQRLRSLGFHFVSLDEALAALQGTSGLPRRALLVTFDDCFVDLLTDAVPVLLEADVPATAFAVARLIGQSNVWDTAIGAPTLPLLDADGLSAVAAAGVDVQLHGATHRSLRGLTAAELLAETSGAAESLTAIGLPPPVAFAYPHGQHDARGRRAVSSAGLRVAFSVRPGMVRPGRVNPMAVPRIEVLRRDGTGLRLLFKVLTAGRWSQLWQTGQGARGVTVLLRRRLRRRAGSSPS